VLDILLVDDEPSILLSLDEALQNDGHKVVTALDGLSAQATLSSRVFDVVICDVRLPKIDGFALLQRVRKTSPSTRCIMMTAYATVADAVGALKDGATDYLAKPFDVESLLALLTRIDQELAVTRQFSTARADSSPDDDATAAGLLGHSPLMVRLWDRIAKFAPSDAPVLIRGETGTGKELVARALHNHSARAEKPFVAVNCAAFPDTLLEAELFGHERGAFTGATRRREGRFRAAEGGTLLLDEVAEIPLPAQAKLLRVLQTGTYEPLGTNKTETAHVRILSATHRDLKEMVSQRLFREDLFFRLKILELEVPPLRERGGDLLLLVDHLLQQFAPAGSSPTISARCLGALTQYPFPGNVRELMHAIQHAVVVAAGAEIDLPHLPPEIGGDDTAPLLAARQRSLSEAVRDFEREYVRRALQQTSGKRTTAAQLLGISRKNLWEKLRGYGLPASDFSPEAPSNDSGNPSSSGSKKE
jgi:DNA-binding NtrC family response regulator